MTRVALITSGGDCQGLNAAMRGIGKALYNKIENLEIFGMYDGYTPTYDTRDLSRDGVEIKLVDEKYGYGEDDTRQHLIMRFGCKYIDVSYSGSSDLGEYTDLYIAKLKA